MIAGITSRKEKVATCLLSKPNKSPVEMVEPDLEMPGTKARACEMPMIMLSYHFIVLFPGNFSEMNSKSAVNSKAMPTALMLVNNEAMVSFRRKPVNAIGMLPMIMYQPSFPLLVFVLGNSFRIFSISLWKTAKITIKVAKCKRMSKNNGTSMFRNC